MAKINRAKPVMWNECDVTKWDFTAPKITNQRTQQAQIYVNSSVTDRSTPTIQLEKMKTPWGFELEPGETLEDVLKTGDKSRLKMKFDVLTPECATFFERIDELVAAKAVEKKWLGDNKKDEDVRTTLHKGKIFARDRNDGRYPDKLKIKVTIAGDRMPECFVNLGGGNYRSASITEITPRMEIMPIVEPSGVWISGIGYGLDLVAYQLQLFPREEAAQGFAFQMPIPMTMLAPDEAAALAGGTAALAGGSNKRALEDGETDGAKAARVAAQAGGSPAAEVAELQSPTPEGASE